jgi:carbon storage regulator
VTESPDIEGRERIMLVLSRKLGEKIVIGEQVVLTVVKVDRNQVRLGIEAPPDVPVFREEIAPAKRAAALMACPT